MSLSPEHYPKMFDAVQTTVGEKTSGHGLIEHILPVHPFIHKEPRHTGIYPDHDNIDAQGVYSRGAALYSDSHIVQARWAELKHQERQLEGSTTSTHQDMMNGQPQLVRSPKDSANNTTNDVQLPPSTDSKALEWPTTQANSVPFRLLTNDERHSDRFGGINERQLLDIPDAYSHTTVSWSSISGLENGRTTSTATSPAEMGDKRGSSEAAPPKQDAW